MARIFQTGFEMGSREVVTGDSGGSVVTTPTGGAYSAYAFKTFVLGSNTHMFLLDSSTGEFYCGVRMHRPSATGYPGSSERTINFVSPNGTTNLQVRLQPSGALDVVRGNAGTTIGSGTTFIPLGAYFYYEVYGLISDTVGKIQTRINGTDDIALTTGLDTRADAAAGGDLVDRFAIGGVASADLWIDDIYFNDTTGAENTGFSGDIRISAYIPNAAGDVTGLTATSGSNYAAVDERPPNDATDYVYDSGTSNYDLYNIPNTSGITSVQAATLWLRAQKSDAGAKNIAHKIKSAATEDTGSDIALSTSWTYYGKVYNVDPTDSNAWTAGKIDALQIGAKAR